MIERYLARVKMKMLDIRPKVLAVVVYESVLGDREYEKVNSGGRRVLSRTQLDLGGHRHHDGACCARADQGQCVHLCYSPLLELGDLSGTLPPVG